MTGVAVVTGASRGIGRFLADALEEAWSRHHPGPVVRRDLGREPLPAQAWPAAVSAASTPEASRSPQQRAAVAFAAGLADEVRERSYLGFRLTGPDGEQCTDGVVRRLQPDVAIVLDTMAELGLPPLESMPPPQLREFMDTINAERPIGPCA